MSGPLRLRRAPRVEAETDGHGPIASPPRVKSGRRRQGVVLLGVAAAALVGAAVWVLTNVGGGGEGEATGTVATTTAEVARRDLVQTETFSGTLGFADERSIAGKGRGTITALAPEGATRRRGEVLYRVDQRPVVLLIGALPAWRALAEGLDGKDVLQLERNLKALGYDPGAVDREFDSDTEGAVQEWQADLGLEETGVVQPADIVFSPAKVRVGSHVASLGQSAQPGAVVMQVTAATQVVTLELDVSDQDLIAQGDEVAVELPDESVVIGTVAQVGTVAEAAPAAEGETEEASPTIEVTIELPAGTSTNLDQAPVDVILTTESKEDVPAVPVTALLALAGGGYAVEVPDGATSRLVPIEPGRYADGYVEVTGGELAEGTSVLVPQ